MTGVAAAAMRTTKKKRGSQSLMSVHLQSGGRRKNVVPRSSDVSSHTLPPCASAIQRAIGRPRLGAVAVGAEETLEDLLVQTAGCRGRCRGPRCAARRRRRCSARDLAARGACLMAFSTKFATMRCRRSSSPSMTSSRRLRDERHAALGREGAEAAQRLRDDFVRDRRGRFQRDFAGIAAREKEEVAHDPRQPPTDFASSSRLSR